MQDDPFDLARFVAAQVRDYPAALTELNAGLKTGHWIWYILPQLRGLGTSRMSDYYGIASLAEARAYLAHPVLGPRLRECVNAISAHEERTAKQILGDVNALKFRSCLTLFNAADGSGSPFNDALRRFFAGKSDQRTLALLAGHHASD